MTEFKGPSGVFVEHRRSVGCPSISAFDVETMDAVFHALEACNVVFKLPTMSVFPPEGLPVLRGQS